MAAFAIAFAVFDIVFPATDLNNTEVAAFSTNGVRNLSNTTASRKRFPAVNVTLLAFLTKTALLYELATASSNVFP